MKKTKRKLIDLTLECIKKLNVIAAENGTNCKNLIETQMEKLTIKDLKKQK